MSSRRKDLQLDAALHDVQRSEVDGQTTALAAGDGELDPIQVCTTCAKGLADRVQLRGAARTVLLFGRFAKLSCDDAEAMSRMIADDLRGQIERVRAFRGHDPVLGIESDAVQTPDARAADDLVDDSRGVDRDRLCARHALAEPAVTGVFRIDLFVPSDAAQALAVRRKDRKSVV